MDPFDLFKTGETELSSFGIHLSNDCLFEIFIIKLWLKTFISEPFLGIFWIWNYNSKQVSL